MQEGTLVRWLKREGDTVEKGEPLVEIETAKINSELEAPESGVLAHVAIQEGATVNVGVLLAIIAEPGEEVAAPPSPAQSQATPARAATQPPPPSSAAAGAQVVPAARRLASEHGIDLSQIQGSGPHGRILEADVSASIVSTVLPEGETVPLTGARRVIAQRMLKSVQTTAPVTITTEADVSECVLLRQELVSKWRPQGTRPVPLTMIIKATSRALVDSPHMNALLIDGGLRLLREVNIGFAVALDEGLIVPVIHNADQKSLLETNQEVLVLADRARKDQLKPEQVAGAGFTVTDLGSYEIDAFTPILDAPQIAILGVGRAVERPAVYQGDIVVRSMMALSLTFDHQAIDGAPAGRFLKAIKSYLEAPEWMA